MANKTELDRDTLDKLRVLGMDDIAADVEVTVRGLQHTVKAWENIAYERKITRDEVRDTYDSLVGSRFNRLNALVGMALLMNLITMITIWATR